MVVSLNSRLESNKECMVVKLNPRLESNKEESSRLESNKEILGSRAIKKKEAPRGTARAPRAGSGPSRTSRDTRRSARLERVC